MKLLIIVLFLVLIYVILFTVYGDALIAWIQRSSHQRRMFKNASRLAKEKGKLLVVIGDPRAQNTMTQYFPTYDCGDICIDIGGCTCNKESVILKMDVLEALKNMKSDSAVIYESEVLEFVDYNITPIVAEIERVSGGDQFSTHFSGMRSRFLSKSKHDAWTPKRIIVQYPPHKPYKWLETPGFASWQM